MIPVIPVGFVYYSNQRGANLEKQKRRLRMQFREMLLSVSTNMKAGYSVENAFREAETELKSLFGEKEIISKELFVIRQGLEHNVPLEQLLSRFGRESEVEEIEEFAQIFATARHFGGNMSEIMNSSVHIISRKMETEDEIQVLLTSKKTESKVMQIVPFLIVFYMQSSSPEFFAPLYHNGVGVVIMTVFLAVYMVSFYLTEKIVAIKM